MTVGCVVLGSSFSKFSAEKLTKITRETPYGVGVIYTYQGTSSFVQFRHGLPHQLLPTQINWRAQAWMWKEFGVQSLLLTSSVGVLDVDVPLYQPLLCSDLLMPFNQLPDGSVCTMFTQPFSTISRFSLVYSSGMAMPGVTLGPPPWLFSARMVVVRTDTCGFNPLKRDLTFQNFSNPISAPKPDSVM